MEVDWEPIAKVCEQRAVGLEQHDQWNRPAFDDVGPVEHKTHCWLGANYANQPNVWARGCDCGAIAEATKKRKADQG